jgi:AAA+ ATPase superfamily predicted ATPase
MLSDAVFLLHEQLDEPRNYVAVLEAIAAGFHRLSQIATHTFEELSREWVNITAEMGESAFLPERTGSFWSKETQVDVLAINWRTKDILLAECKWWQKAVGRGVIQSLVDKTEKVLPGQHSWKVHYALFARKNFTPAAEALAQKQGVRLVTLEQIDADMQRWLRKRTADSEQLSVIGDA